MVLFFLQLQQSLGITEADNLRLMLFIYYNSSVSSYGRLLPTWHKSAARRGNFCHEEMTLHTITGENKSLGNLLSMVVLAHSSFYPTSTDGLCMTQLQDIFFLFGLSSIWDWIHLILGIWKGQCLQLQSVHLYCVRWQGETEMVWWTLKTKYLVTVVINYDYLYTTRATHPYSLIKWGPLAAGSMGK